MIITRGESVEVFNPRSKHSCSLRNLPSKLINSQQICGKFLCGGVYSSVTGRSCLKLNPLTGSFTPTSVSLVEKRTRHLCWDVEGEGGPTLLLGGRWSPGTTELVSPDGSSSSASFRLHYGIWYII